MTLPEIEQPTKVPVGCLRLDRENPRLTGGTGHRSDEALVAELYDSAELDELLQSMTSNGYLDIEPLVVMEEPENGELVVLEGNRRLATVLLLTDPEFVSRVRGEPGLSRLTIPEIRESLRPTFEQVTVYRVSDRTQARPLIGFKHINVPQKWQAYAKARFAAKWYNESDVGLDEIAKAIGDRHDTIKRMVSAIYVLEQASEQELFEVEDRFPTKFNFSHLYTALSRSQYMAYLGLPRGWARYDPKPDPVPGEKMEELGQVLRWIYGYRPDDQEQVVKRQNPDIKRLGEVLAKREAVLELKVTADLDRAHSVAEPASARFTSSLIKARRALQDAVGSVRGYDGRDGSLLGISEDIKIASDLLLSKMKEKYLGAGDP